MCLQQIYENDLRHSYAHSCITIEKLEARVSTLSSPLLDRLTSQSPLTPLIKMGLLKINLEIVKVAQVIELKSASETWEAYHGQFVK